MMFGSMQPPKLSWVTLPLFVLLVFEVLFLLSLMVFGVQSQGPGFTTQNLGMLTLVMGDMLWVSFLFTAMLAAFTYSTYRDMPIGKRWARIAAVELATLSLLNFPFGTMLGVLMLIGAFDPEVQRYASR